jgi:hypothetical protein
MKSRFQGVIILFLFVIPFLSRADPGLEIRNRLSGAPVKHGIRELQRLIGNEKIKMSGSDWVIKTGLTPTLGHEAYKIEKSGSNITVTGGDATGVMYGLLSIKEQLKNGKTEIASSKESPRFPFRALKFNLPWDSYRVSDALQLHYETCRDTNFWSSFLDMMAENRFNALTLWNLHPFNYLVKTKKYPEACSFTDAEMVKWETFWKTIFRMAKERGIETYLINWNIFVSPEFAKAHHVADYCLTNEYNVPKGDTSEIIKDYTRECVKEVINKYPDLTGLGITLGEGMGGMTADEREQWLIDSYIEGMRMASRKVKFIHRAPLSAGKGSGGTTSSYVEKMTRKTLDTLSCVQKPITIELKFNWSHAHSCIDLIKVHGGELTDAYWNPVPKKYQLSWMMRNEDFFALRWGQPDFIREHIAKNGQPYVNGYFVGSECYIPAKDYITALPNTSIRYAFERQWMFYKEWGRLLYNPATPDAVFSDAFEGRFPGKGRQLFDAQKKVSRIPLIVASYWNATWDFTLYSEGMMSIMDQDSVKLISLTDMCRKMPMSPAYQGIKDFVAGGMKSVHRRITPVQLADSIDSFCKSAIKEIESISAGTNINLLYEVSDIKVWANLGMYFSNKLKSAIDYQQYVNSGDQKYLKLSINWLEKATVHWHQVVEITTPLYKIMPLVHYEKSKDKLFHWSKVEKEVNAELVWLKGQSL